MSSFDKIALSILYMQGPGVDDTGAVKQDRAETLPSWNRAYTLFQHKMLVQGKPSHHTYYVSFGW